MRQGHRSRSLVLLAVVVAAAAGLASVACNELSGTGATDPGAATTLPGEPTTEGGTTSTEPAVTTTLPGTSTSAAVQVDASEELTASGHIRACGIIKEARVVGGVRKIKIDYVDFLMGAEADAAAIADGVIPAGEHVDNDYYVRNNNTKLRTFTVSDSVQIITYSRDTDPSSADPAVTWAAFVSFWDPAPAPSDFGLSDGLWWIERDAVTNAVVSIEQQWVP